MKVLHIAAGLPSKERPFQQPFIKSQIDSLINEGIDIEIVEIKGYESSYNYIKAILITKEIVKTKGIDIIHAHYSYCGLVALFANIKVPIILSLMGGELLAAPNFNGRYEPRGKIDKLLTKIIINKFDHIIVKSDKMKDLIKTSVPVSVIPNGVNFEIFKPKDLQKSRKKLGLNENDFIILFLGNKNIELKNYQLANKSVEKFKKDKNIKNIILLTPFGIGQTEVVDYMNAADVLLLTSFYEGSPNVIKEAMACNLPIISVDVGDVKDRITNVFNCFIVSNSVEDILEKLEVVYNNKKRSDGRDKIYYLSSEKIAKIIIDVYEAVLDNSK